MTVLSAAAALNRPAAIARGAGELSHNYGEYVTLTGLVTTDTIRMCKLPARHVAVDLILTTDDQDTNGSPAVVIDVGIEDTVGATDDPNALISASTVGQAGGVARMNVNAGVKIAPVDYDRYVTITPTTSATTGVVGATITAALLSRPAGQDD